MSRDPAKARAPIVVGDAPEAPPPPATRAQSSPTLRNAAVFMAVVLGGVAVRVLQGIVTPLVVAVFMLLLIDGFSRAVARRFPSWPEWLRLTLAAVLIIAGFGVIVGICAHYGRPFVGQLKILQPKLDTVLEDILAALQLPPLTLEDMLAGLDPTTSLGRIFGAARGFLSEAVLVIIYLGFLLASRQTFARKLVRLFRAPERQADALRVFERVRIASERYMGLQTLKALLIGAVAWAVMGIVGLQGAVFLAFLTFLAAYIPIVGSIGAAIVPTLLALAQFDSPVRPLILLVLLGVTFFLIENVLLPKLQSDRLNIDPVFVLLSLGFWGVILGAPGVLLSTPLTVVVMSIAAEFEGARWLAVLISKEGEPAGEEIDRTG